MKAPVLLRAATAAAACAALAACGLGLQPTVTLVTDRPEMAAYVDGFNATHADVKVQVAWAESPAQAVMDGVQADIVIGEYLCTPAVMDRLDILSDIIKPGKLEPSSFYLKLLAMGSRENRPFLVPLSFSLPAVVFLSAQAPASLPPMFMPMDTLRDLGAAYNRAGRTGTWLAMGFSPAWNGDFLTASALLLGARFRAGRGGAPTWDEAGLARTTDYIGAWIRDADGGAAAEAEFAARALVQPWYKLLASGKIRFALVSFTDLFALPEDRRRDFDFRWLSRDGLVPVLDDVLFGGVLRSSRNKSGARAFLVWFAGLPTQSGPQGLLSMNTAKRIGVFGVTNGFSALKSVNEKELPQRYPLLIGHVPSESSLVFPEILPDSWTKIRGTSRSDGVIWPWIIASASGSATQPLDKAIQAWQQAQKD